jgi:alkylmercury lyase-like protein
MLFFRSEEHIDRWCESWRFARGAVMSLDTAWQLARAWYSADRREPEWRRRSVDEVEALFAELGLTTDFWRLR